MEQKPSAQQPESGGLPVKAEARIYITPDRLEAGIVLIEPQNGGENLKAFEIKSFLAKNNVCYGINDAIIALLETSPKYEKRIPLAKGVPCNNGADASMEYMFKLETDLRPNILPDGTVDYRNLGIVQIAKANDVLAKKTPATNGTPGTDVFGMTIPPKPGKDLRLPFGKNTTLSEDGNQVLSAIDGQIEIINNRICVLDVFVVDGNVSNATGNIDFTGNLLINGDVQDGFTVKAGGNIDIKGAVEAAVVEAGGTLIIAGGFNGGGKGKLKAGSHIACKYVQAGEVQAGGNVDTTYIYNAKVQSKETVRLPGKGSVVGSHVIARTTVEAATIGSANSSAQTIIEVGGDPELVQRSHEIPEQQASCKKNIQSFKPILDTLSQLKAAGRLPEDKTEQLAKVEQVMAQLYKTQAELEAEMDSVNEQLKEVGNGIVKVSKTAFRGTKIMMGSEVLILKGDYPFVKFSRDNKRIISTSLR